MSSISNSGDESLAGASICLIPGTSELRNLLAGTLAEHNLFFERRGGMLALVGPKDPAQAVELLRHSLKDADRSNVMVASIGSSGFPEQRSLDDWWRIRETAWFEHAITNPFEPGDPESRGPAFSIWFQPVVDTSNNRVFGHECLTRAHSGTRETPRRYSAAEILDAAWLRRRERDLDNKLRQLAISAAARWSGAGNFFINFLPHTVFEPGICLADTLAALKHSLLPPRRFVFEAVHGAGNDHGHLASIAATFRERGCQFSLDDLSLANGGLRLLRELKPDYVKLASTLMGDVESSVCASAIRRIVEEADLCGTRVVAKNVEDARTVENLWLLGVRFMQGYFFGRPAPTPVQPKQDLLKLSQALEDQPTLALNYRN